MKKKLQLKGKGNSGGANEMDRDSWADPNKQPPPAAWPTMLEPLAETLRGYVKDTLVAFKEAGIELDIVSLGNEIRHGILWPLGYVCAKDLFLAGEMSLKL